MWLYRSRDFTAAKTARTNVDMPGSPADNGRDAPNVRFPHAVAASVGVTYFYAERNALAAKFTFSHLLHLLPESDFKTAFLMITERRI